MTNIKSAHYCPSCEQIWDKSHRFCPECPTTIEGSPGTFLVRVFNYGEGYLIFQATDMALADLELK